MLVVVGAALPDPLPGHVSRTLAAASPESMRLQSRAVDWCAGAHSFMAAGGCGLRVSVGAVSPGPFLSESVPGPVVSAVPESMCPDSEWRAGRGPARVSRAGSLRGLVGSPPACESVHCCACSIAMRRVSVWHSEMV